MHGHKEWVRIHIHANLQDGFLSGGLELSYIYKLCGTADDIAKLRNLL